MKNCRMKIMGMAKGVVLLLLLSGLLVSVAYAAANSSGAFKDTIGHWASLSIDRLASLGIIGGYEDGTFKPNERVSRAEMATIVNRTLDLVGYENPGTTEAIAKGARLYDDWAKESGAAKPADNQPIWALQTSNTRNGFDTWRCKECHGWDYKGKGGAYGSGSHATGFTGVYRASTSMNKVELLEALKGSNDYKHDFSSVLSEEDLQALAAFLKDGLINDVKYVDYSTKAALGANLENGEQKFAVCASCHGTDGTQLNFGSDAAPEYVGTIAKSNPWEFIHKVRFGQPGTGMPYASTLGWTQQDVVDVLGYTQSLPVSK